MKDDLKQQSHEALTVGKILRDLEPGQFWGVLVALATIVGGSFWLGGRFPIVPVLREQPVACSEVPSWPRGKWVVWGRLDTPLTKKNTDNYTRFPQISSEVAFVSSDSYETQTEEHTDDATKRVFTSHAQKEITPGATVDFEGSDGTGYLSKATLTISEDGCLMDGRFTDTKGNAGTLHYLYFRPRYYVLPK